jgi:kinesin family protein 14
MAFATPKRNGVQAKTNEIINKFNSASKQQHQFTTPTLPQKRTNEIATPLTGKKQATSNENILKTKKQLSTATVSSNQQQHAQDSANTQQNDNLITVAVRIRPLETKETASGHINAVRYNSQSNQILVINDHKQQPPLTFTCDHVITDQKPTNWAQQNLVDGGDAQQQYVYECLGRPLLNKAFAGYNVSIFAYGQTGSGKTYSMIGSQEQPGLIPRFFEELFSQRNAASADAKGGEYTNHIEISYYEIYNEKIYDLLRSNSTDSKGMCKLFFYLGSNNKKKSR